MLKTPPSNSLCQRLFPLHSFYNRARQGIEETSWKKITLQLILWRQDTRDPFGRDKAPQDMRGLDPMIMTTRGDKIDDVISIQVRCAGYLGHLSEKLVAF